MKFEEIAWSREDRYSLGIETDSGSYFASIPVSNPMVDYAEYYRLTDEEYPLFIENRSLAVEFVESCRRREQDERLFMKPGRYRGVPR